MMQTPAIKENSTWARLAALMMREPRMAMVLGSTIHLYGVSRDRFLSNSRWVKHELKHIDQFRQYGTAGFLIRYTWEFIRKGYFNNRFEVEARQAELE